MVFYGTHARLINIPWLVALIYVYIHEWQKLRQKTHRILILVLVFMTLMFLVCLFFPQWHGWGAIPLTILWYPLHRWILKGLPRKETNNSDIPFNNHEK